MIDPLRSGHPVPKHTRPDRHKVPRRVRVSCRVDGRQTVLGASLKGLSEDYPRQPEEQPFRPTPPLLPGTLTGAIGVPLWLPPVGVLSWEALRALSIEPG